MTRPCKQYFWKNQQTQRQRTSAHRRTNIPVACFLKQSQMKQFVKILNLWIWKVEKLKKETFQNVRMLLTCFWLFRWKKKFPYERKTTEYESNNEQVHITDKNVIFLIHKSYVKPLLFLFLIIAIILKSSSTINQGLDGCFSTAWGTQLSLMICTSLNFSLAVLWTKRKLFFFQNLALDLRLLFVSFSYLISSMFCCARQRDIFY